MREIVERLKKRVKEVSPSGQCGKDGHVLAADAFELGKAEAFLEAIRLIEEGLVGRLLIDVGEVARMGHELKRLSERESELLAELTKRRLEWRGIRHLVFEFHKMVGQAAREEPIVPPDNEVRMRLRLVLEEAFELLEACLVVYPAGNDDRRTFETAHGLVDRIINTFDVDVDLPAAADALTDLDYVNEGTRLTFGIDGRPLLEEVHRSNMEKRGSEVREDGKILKPDDWTPPDIAGELQKQGWEP